MNCKFCDKEYTSNRSVSTHQTYCKENPNKIEGSGTGRVPWNKGMTGISTGICKDPEKEKIRKLKISATMKLNPKAGRLRKGSGRGKKGRYKGFFCDSTWELAFIIYHLDKEIKIERNTLGLDYNYKSKDRKYFPDFIVDNIYYEIKGRRKYEDLDEQTKLKVDTFSEVKILYEPDMKIYLDYVKDNYGTDFISMYE